MSVSLAIENVARHFGTFPALKGVSLTVGAGELVALLGPSGSGKTTLLRLIAGLDPCDGGRILFDRVDGATLTLRDRRIGMVFQNYALFRHLTVADNIAFGLRSRPRGERPGEAEIARRVGELLDLVQLPGLERRFPSQLSGGQRQRVALARALAIEPRVLLLDEPFGALDAKVRKDLRAWLRDVHRRTGHTTLFVTHDQDEALELADRIAVLDRGLLEQVGTPGEVFDRPATAFVCAFLGETNRLPVEVTSGRIMLAGRAVLAAASGVGDGAAAFYARPHQIGLDAPGAAAIEGEVTGLRGHGAVRRVEIAVTGLARPIQVDVTNAAAPAIGQRVGLRLLGGHLFPT